MSSSDPKPPSNPSSHPPAPSSSSSPPPSSPSPPVYIYQIPPPPFPSSSPETSQTISAIDRFHGTLSGAWRGGWGAGTHGTDSWVDPNLRGSDDPHRSLAPARPHNLADVRRREGAKARRERLRRVWEGLPTRENHRRPASAATARSDHPPAPPPAAPPDYAGELVKQCVGPGMGPRGAPEEGQERLDQQHHHHMLEEGTERVGVTWRDFCSYAEEKERELWQVYQELDKNQDMRLDRDELKAALERAGIRPSEAAFEQFFTSLDQDKSGHIEFTDFRDYLLLLPRRPAVAEIYRFYETRNLARGATQVTPDGDVVLSGEDKARKPKPSISSPPAEAPARAEGARAVQGGLREDSLDEEEDALLEEGEEEEEEEEEGILGGPQAVKFLLAGGVAGAVSRTATAPFDRLKVYLITSTKDTPSAGAAAADVARHPAHAAGLAQRGLGTLAQAMRNIYREGGGVRAFWVGNGLNVVKIFPESAIKFLSYETAKRVFAKHWDCVEDQTQISASSRFIAGGLGGITSQLAIYPIETIKTRMMSSRTACTPGSGLVFKTARDMWHRAGFTAFYRGLPAGLIGVFPYSAIDMSTFEALKLAYVRYRDGDEPGNVALLMFGSLSGSIGATSVYPLNLLRTRLQASGTPAHPQVYEGFRDVAWKTYEREGVRGFYRGLVPTLAKVVPAVSLSYLSYEHAKRYLGV